MYICNWKIFTLGIFSSYQLYYTFLDATKRTTMLFDEVENLNEQRDEHLHIPKDGNNTDYKLDDLNNDQFKIAFVILTKIKEWLQCKETSKPFEPLRMTICGMAGTGKSRLINTLVSIY